MKVERVELWHVDVPLEETFRPAWLPGYPQTHNRFTLLRVTTDAGLEGVAAGQAFGRERAGLGDVLGGYLVGEDATDLDLVRQRIRELSYLGWRNPWMEAAFWDILGKVEGEPVWRLLAGDDHEAPGTLEAYASSGERRSPEEAASLVEDRAAEGWGAVKLRVHAPTLEEDVAVVEAAREAAGDDLTLAVDANQGWPVDLFGDAPRWDLARARAFCQAAADLDVAWVEEPLDMHAFDDMAALRDAVDVPVAGGELADGPAVLERFLREGCVDVLQPDATLACGVGTARELMERCLDAGVGFTPHTWTNGLGLVVNLHVLASHPDPGLLEFPVDPPGWTPEGRDALLTDPVRAQDGRVAVPRDPGLGIVVDEDALEAHGTRFHVSTPAGVAWDLLREKGAGGFWEIVKQRLGWG